MNRPTELPDVPDTIFTRDEVIAFIRTDRAAHAPCAETLGEREVITLANELPGVGDCISGNAAFAFAAAIQRAFAKKNGLQLAGQVDKPADLHGKLVDEIADLQGQAFRCRVPITPTIAECIAQLDVWNGHLEAAIDRQAHQVLGQHPNDEPADARDPMEQLP